MRTGWIVYRGIDAHTVVYMDWKGNAVGAGERAFFETEEKAKATARAFGWRSWETARHNRP